MARVWEKFLSDQDKEILATSHRPASVGFGDRPAMLLIDNYRGPVGKNLSPTQADRARSGAFGETQKRALLEQQRLLAVFRELDLPVIHVTKMAFGNVPGWRYCVQHPEERAVLRGPIDLRPDDCEIVEEVAPTPQEFTITKASPSVFMGTPLVGLLRFLDVDTLVVVGSVTSGCVRATVDDATAYRYRTIVAEEGVYDRFEASHAMNLFNMHMNHADVLPMDSIIQHLNSVHMVSNPAVLAN